MPKVTKNKPKPPQPFEIDAMCEEIERHKSDRDAIEETIADLSDQLLALIRKHGEIRGEKSKALVGLVFDAVRTDGHRTEIDVTGVGIVYSRLKAAKAQHLFKRLFVKETRFVLAPGYEDFLKSAAKDGPKNLAALFYDAVRITPKAPTLAVRKLKQEKKAKKASAAA